ncbi:hypothetical protein HCU64_22130 [Methylobacterium sp. C25]|uniref:hypothetical protein n=1 Tax=Methylobacterium sp. C25 TaxID=2721622 RepID=UPI001F164829|nr:hypothetical protein [Methylobacterium sp. C25]MCE4226450.1 hypothetical protein [Methylobacterium sp. C25]
MIDYRFCHPRSFVMGSVLSAVLPLLMASAATARPEPGVFQVAQAESQGEPVPAKPHAVRKPKPKPAAHAASKADTPLKSTPPAATVAPVAAAAADQATQPATPPASATEATAAATISEPVRHAREAKLGRCVDTISKASSSTIDTAHAAVSTWSQKVPDEHMFQSIVALSYSNKVAPKAATVLVAAPEGPGCEATTVQVYPTTRSCDDVEGDLKKAGRKVGDFGGVAMTQEQGTSRHLLLPAPGTGCVVVAVGLALNQ